MDRAKTILSWIAISLGVVLVGGIIYVYANTGPLTRVFPNSSTKEPAGFPNLDKIIGVRSSFFFGPATQGKYGK